MKRKLSVLVSEMSEEKVEKLIEEHKAEAGQYMPEPLGHVVDVRRDPVDPTSMIVELEIKPVALRTVWWCWDCGQPSYLALSDVVEKCFCGSDNIHGRKRTALDAMKESGDEE